MGMIVNCGPGAGAPPASSVTKLKQYPIAGGYLDAIFVCETGTQATKKQYATPAGFIDETPVTT